MKISKQEILDILKKNNFTEEQAEQILEMLGKGLGGSILDIAKLGISKIENEAIKSVASMVFGALEPKAREAVDEIKVTL